MSQTKKEIPETEIEIEELFIIFFKEFLNNM